MNNNDNNNPSTTEGSQSKEHSSTTNDTNRTANRSESPMFPSLGTAPFSIAFENTKTQGNTTNTGKPAQPQLSPAMAASCPPSSEVSPQFEDAPEDPFGDHSNQISLARPQRTPSSLDALAALACADADAVRRVSVMGSGTTTEKSRPSRQSFADIPSTIIVGEQPPTKTKAPKSEARVVSDDTVVSSDGKASSFQISPHDVLCGRGGLTNHHPGNVTFRTLVRHSQEAYLRASKRDKAGVARKIVDTIRSLNPPGRFLKKDPSNPGVWVEIGNRKAREKTSQALREGAPELREELSAAQALTAKVQGQIPQHQGQNQDFPNDQSPMKDLSRMRVVTNDITENANEDQPFVPLPVPSSMAPMGLHFLPRRSSTFEQPLLKRPHIVSDEDQAPSPVPSSPSGNLARASSPSFASQSRGAAVLASLASGSLGPLQPETSLETSMGAQRARSPPACGRKRCLEDNDSDPEDVVSSSSLTCPSSPPSCAVQGRASDADREASPQSLGPPRRRFKARMMEKCF